MIAYRSMAFCVLALGTALLVTACSGSQPTPTVTTNGTGEPVAKRLVMAMNVSAVESTVPNQGGPTQHPIWPLYEYLLGVSPEGQDNVPMLAESWSVEPDGKSFRFKLRKGVAFHKGKGEFAAKDVVYSWKHMIATDAIHRQSPYFRRIIQDVEVVNDYEVVFRMAGPDANFFNAMGQGETGLSMMSAADGQSRTKMPAVNEEAIAGTGPFQFVKWDQGSSLLYEKVPYQHWRKTPEFQEFEFRWMKEPSTRLAALLSHEIQIADLPADMLQEAQKSGFKVVEGKSATAQYMWVDLMGVYLNKSLAANFGEEQLNPDPNALYVHPDTPLLDVRVRRALSKAVDRTALNKSFFGGKAEPMYLNNFHPTRAGWDPSWERRFPEQYGYDPAKARQLLAEAGYGPNNPLKHEVLLYRLPQFGALPDLAEAIGNYYRAVGIEVTLVPYDPATFVPKQRKLQIKSQSKPYIASCRQYLCFGVFMTLSDIGGRGSAVELQDLSDLFNNRIRTELDSKKAEELWRQAGNMAFDQAVGYPLFWAKAEAAVDPSIVSDWLYPGNMTGSPYSHFEYAVPVRR